MFDWTPERIELLRQYLSTGKYSFAQVGAILGCSRNAALSKARRLGIKVDPTRSTSHPSRRRVPGKPRPARRPTKETPYVPPAPKVAPAPVPALPEAIAPEAQQKAVKAARKGKRRFRVRLPAWMHEDDDQFFKYIAEIGLHASSDIHNIPGRLQCKWITGDVLFGHAHWCRAPVVANTSWCKKHLGLVYDVGRARITRK